MIVMRKIFVKGPARVDFAGGWTDNGIYPKENPAAVLNAGIDCLGIEISISPAKQFQVNQDSQLLRACLDFLKLENPDIEIDIQNSIPVGSGLGGSGLLIYALLAGILSYQGKKIDKIQLMNSVIEVEKVLGSCGGWNDTSALYFPGIALTQTSPDKPGQYYIQHIMDPEFEKLCLLIDTGVRRDSIDFNIIRNQYTKGDKLAIQALAYIREAALNCWHLFINKKYLHFAKLMSETWQKVCEVGHGTWIEQVGEIQDIIGGDLAGFKLCGAGGGGFGIAILIDPKTRDEVAHRLKKKFQVYKPCFRSCLEIKKSEII